MRDIEPQVPAEGIMEMNRFGGSRTFRVSCVCGDHDHEMWMDVECEDDFPDVTVTSYAKLTTDYWTEARPKRYDIDNNILQEWDWRWKGLYNGLATRLRITWELWTKGEVTYQASTILSRQAALNLSVALAQAIEDVIEETSEVVK
jgi:hypothetical protein